MILRRMFPDSAEYHIGRISADDAETVARLHAGCFSTAWSAEEFEALLSQETVFGFVAQLSGRPGQQSDGFVLARLAAGEAEILTIAVMRARRGQGLGRLLMEAVLRHLHAERAEALFLEVEETNRAALALYRRLGFTQIGQRPGYYSQFGGGGAIVMRLGLK